MYPKISIIDDILLTKHVVIFQWTLMKFMIDGGSSAPLPKARKWLRVYPEASKKLLELLTAMRLQ